MKKTISLIFLFIFAFLAFALYLVPASVVLSMADSHLPQNVKLAGVSGTIWQGRVAQVQFNQQLIDKLEWQLKPLSLISGNLNADISFGSLRGFDTPFGKTSVSLPLSAESLKLTRTNVRLSTSMLLDNVKLPMALPTKGNLKIKLSDAEFPLIDQKQLCNTLAGQAETHNLSVQGLQGWIEFDTIRGKLSCDNGALSLNISEENQLGLQLEAQYGIQIMKVSGFVKPDASMPKQVHDAVKFLGKPDNNGRYPFKF